ncbi:IS21 family transposase [Alcaligenes phenolicus]|uniref:IS21 family transposase n=1 Tax=Alcaligenes phenolicus TaxID=232846 RepID=A0AAW5VRW6_9BURK|nr:IS21 family transposase [Alcaligenes phenolicus]MCX5565676.1 IS21 family transposase [Alcaligenes phenolicus]
MYQYRQALLSMRRGDTDRQIAQTKVLGRPKLAQLREQAVSHGWLEPDAPLPDDAVLAEVFGKTKRASSTQSSLEAHRQRIAEWMQAGVGGPVILSHLQRSHGYTGSYSSVYRMMVSIAGARPAKATIPLAFGPGEAVQVDFGAGPLLHDPASGKVRRAWAFVMTLCFSRHQYLEFVWDQKVATWLGCHRRAFEWFGGVPKRVIIDNAKCAIIKACVTDPVVQRSYAECAEGYGFRIDPCPPADPQKKGIVESGVKYVKNNFLPLRTFRDMTDLNRQAGEWVVQYASERIHGTTRKKPSALFQIERSALLALPAIAPDLGVWQPVKVHRDCHVAYERALYSVPFRLVGQTLWLRSTDSMVALYQNHNQVAAHRRARRPGERLTVRDHLPPEAVQFLSRDRQWCQEQAGKIGPSCKALVTWLLTDRVLERLRAAQGVLRLGEQYGNARLELACERAMAHASPYYRTVKTILAGNHDQHPVSPLDTQAVYASSARFARPAHHLFEDASSMRQ